MNKVTTNYIAQRCSEAECYEKKLKIEQKSSSKNINFSKEIEKDDVTLEKVGCITAPLAVENLNYARRLVKMLSLDSAPSLISSK